VSEDGLSKGSAVVIRGLVKADGWNGKRGTLQNYDKRKARWNVKFDDGKILAVKPENLQPEDQDLQETPSNKYKPRSDKATPRAPKTSVRESKNGGRDSIKESIGEGASRDKSRSPFILTRYIHLDAEEHLPWVRAKNRKLKWRVDGKKRLSNPFEHTCGGNQDYNESLGNDGLSNFISFSNAQEFPDVAEDCAQPWDKGQVRIRVDANKVKRNKIIDLSTRERALRWCYEGGTLLTFEKRKLKFEGAKTIKPWPYKCAKSVYQTERQKSWGAPPDEWWTPENRRKVAEKCAEWASLSKEVLVLPDPDKILKGIWRNAVVVETDRPRAKNLCITSTVDKCVSFNYMTNEVCCCSVPSCGVPCPRGPGI
jgi:hypothetical protein